MTLTYDHSPGRILMKEDGVAFFDTDAYPVMLASTIDVTGQTISFPDLFKGIGYAFARGLRGSDMYRSCQSVVTLGPQEWGPSNMKPPADAGRVLSETVLTTVPAACDGLLVQAKLNRTSTPSTINGNTIPVLPKTGEWVTAPGGSLPLEFLQPLSRQIDVVLQTDSSGNPVYNVDGTRNVVLQRRQSVTRRLYGFYGFSNTTSGWTAHGGGGNYGHLVYPIQTKPAAFTTGDGTDYSYGGSAQCSLVDPTDYSSTYSADFRITPMFINEAPDNSGTNTKTGFFSGQQSTGWISAGQSTPFTFPDFQIGADHPSRYVYIWFATTGGSGAPSTTLTNIKVNGVTGAVAMFSQNFSGGICQGLYRMAVPTGSEIDVELTFGAALEGVLCGVFVTYNLTAPTVPVRQLQLAEIGTNTSPGTLVDVSGGAIVLFMATYSGQPPYPDLGGNLPGWVMMTSGVDFDYNGDVMSINAGSPSAAIWMATLTPTTSSIRMKARVDVGTSSSSDYGSGGTPYWIALVLN